MAAVDDVRSEFDTQRRKATEQVAANVQAKRDAITRRAAALGGGPGGALIKTEQKAIDEGGRQLQSANENIDSAQNSELRRLREVDEGRKYQTSERLGSQDFASGQADLGRKFTTSERMGGQDFGANQALLGRQFATSERLGGQDFAAGESAAGRGLQKDLFLAGDATARLGLNQQRDLFLASDATARRGQDAQERGLAQQKDIFLAQDATARLGQAQQADQFNKQFGFSQQQFEHEKYVDSVNEALANRVQSSNEKNPGLLGNILGDLGNIGGGGGGIVGKIGGGSLGRYL